MESAPASECPAADRSDHVLDPVCDGIGLDGERNHQRLCEGTPGRKPIGAGRFFHSSPRNLRFKFTDNLWATRIAGRRR